MGRTTTLLEGLCGHAMSLAAQSMEVEYKDGREYVVAKKGAGFAFFSASSRRFPVT